MRARRATRHRVDGLSRTRRHVEAAWHSFVLDGALTSDVRPEILRSWQRVRAELHVDPGLRTCPRVMAVEEALERARSEHAHRVASRLVAHFADRLAADGHVVAYFDVEGVMLSLAGNAATRGRLADVNFAPGSCWSEESAGTNGPGTALAEARPVEVFATEHFVEAWHAWSCASVPVVVEGRTVGVVDITSPWSARNPSLLLTAEALARAIASEIEADAARQRGAMLAQVARDALRAREEILSVVSHELKTPLTPLRLKVEQVQRLLGRGGERVDPGQLTPLLRGTDRHLGRLVRFIDDLLDASRVLQEPLHLALAPTDLARAVEDGLERRRPDLERLGCDVRVHASPGVVGRWDAARLALAFEQLLLNAMRYAPGPIEVEVLREGATALLVIRDHGPGIPAEDQERIFLPFERAVSSRHASGLGLGLHSVRRIVEAHGGTVHVQSAPGRGTTFALELPLEVVGDGLELGAALDA
jgi:signal transduction histidine kinase